LASSSEPLRLSFRRSGGIAGGRLELELGEDELAPAEAAALDDVRTAGGFERFAQTPGTGAGADEYQYDLTARRGAETTALRFDESRVPAALAPLVELLERRAEEALRRRRHP